MSLILRHFLLYFLCSALVTQAETESELSKRTQITPTLDLLPKGSTLKDVRIPRYDENKNPAALLRAELMKVVSENYVSAEEISLVVYETDGEEQLQVHMLSADYNVSEGILEAYGPLQITGERFNAQGSGAIFQLDSRRGFLHGPASTLFLPESKEDTSMVTPHPLRLFAVLLTGSSSLALAMPEPFSTQELNQLEAQLASQASPLLTEVAPTRQAITRSDQLSKAASVGFQHFVSEIKRPALFTAAAVGVSTKQTPPQPEADGLLVTCDGGMYIDAEKGHVVYLKNIFIQEPRFTMRAGKELKIFLTKKAKAPKEDSAPEAKLEEPPKEKNRSKLPAFEGPADFSDVKSIIASGGVEVIKKDLKDPKADPIRAHAATATYDAKTGDIVLRGDFPFVQQGKKYIRAQESGLYIRIYANGNVYFEPGKWETFANKEELEKKRK